MKKKFSFLSKLGVSAAALALVGGGLAWAGTILKATSPGKTKVWVVPEEALKTGQVYTFIGFDGDNGRKQLDNKGDVVAYDLSAADRSFSVSASTENQDAILLQALNNDGTESGKYLKYDASVVANEDKPEIQWQSSFTSATEQSLVNLSNDQRFYFDTNAHKFQTTADEGAHFAAYVQKEIDNTKITIDNSTKDEGKDGNYYWDETDKIAYFRVGDGVTTPQINITAPSAGDNVNTIILYAVTSSKEVPASTDWTKAETTASSGAHTKTLSLSDDMFTAGTVQYLHTRLAVYDGDNQLSETTDVLLKLERVNLDKPTIPEYAGRNASNGYTITATATNATNIVAAETEADLATATDASVSGTENSLVSFTKTVYAKTTSEPFYDIESGDVSVAPYYTESTAKDLFSIAVKQPTDGKAVSGSTIKVNCARNTMYSYTFNIVGNDKTAPGDWTVTVGDETIDVTDVSVNEETYTLTVPEGVQADKAFTLNIPADAWYGVSSGTDVNKVYSNSTTATFNSLYAGRTFTMNPGFNKIADNASADFSFNIDGPVAGKKTLVLEKGDNTKTVTEGDEIAKQVTVTKGDGETKVTGWTISYDASQDLPYKIDFNTSLEAGDYLITFPAGTLVDEDNKYTNQYNTTAHIYVKEYVTFKFEITDADGNLVDNVCENDKCYFKVTTSTASGEAPTFTYNGETHASGYRLPRSKYGETSGITVPSDYSSSTSYKPEFTANQFYANYNYNDDKKTENTAKVWRHVIISSKGEVSADVNASTVGFYIGAKHKSDQDYLTSSEFSLALQDGGVTVKIDGKDANLKVDKDGNATLTLPSGEDKLDEGTYTVSYTYKSGTDGATEFGDPCSHTVQQVINLISPSFTFDVASTICSNMTSFTVTPSVSIGSATAGSATDLSVDEVMSDGTVKEDVGTLDKTNNTITLNNAPTAGTHTYKIPAGAYTNGVSQNTGSETVTLTVTQHGEYTIIENAENPVKVEHNTTATSVKFHMTLTPGTDPVFSDMDKVALVDGSTTVHPTSVALQETSSVEGTYEFIATFAHEFVPNNYNISIAKGGITATGVDANDVVLNIPISVYKAVPTFTATAATALVANEDAQDVTLALTATDEEEVNRTANIGADLREWTILPPNATEALTLTSLSVSSAGSYKLNYAFKQAGTYTVTAPAGKFTVDASSNASAISWTINVEAAAVWYPNNGVGVNPSSTETTLATTINYTDTEIFFPVNKLQGNSDDTYALNENFAIDASKINLVYLDENGAVYPDNDSGKTPFSTSGYSAVIANNSEGVKCVKLTFPAIDPTTLDDEIKSIRIFFDGSSIKCGATEQVIPSTGSETRGIAIAVKQNFEFNHYLNGTTLTTASDVNTAVGSTTAGVKRAMDKITYKRINNNKIQAICVPFDMKVTDDLADQFSIVKLEAVRKTNEGATAFYFITLKTGETAYANMPYIISPNASYTETNFNVDFEDAYMYVVDPGSVTASSTTTNYVFTGISTAKAWESGDDFWYLSDGAIHPAALGNTVPAWTWYMTSNNSGKPEHYARIFIDGDEVDGEATGINEIISSGALDNAPVYNVAGQRMNGMKSGVNIVNGKKIFKQ